MYRHKIVIDLLGLATAKEMSTFTVLYSIYNTMQLDWPYIISFFSLINVVSIQIRVCIKFWKLGAHTEVEFIVLYVCISCQCEKHIQNSARISNVQFESSYNTENLSFLFTFSKCIMHRFGSQPTLHYIPIRFQTIATQLTEEITMTIAKAKLKCI